MQPFCCRHSPDMNEAGLISCHPTRAVGRTRDSVGYTRRTGACGATKQSWTQSCHFRLATVLLIPPEVHMCSCTPYFQRDKRHGWVSSAQSPTKLVDRDMEHLGCSTLFNPAVTSSKCRSWVLFTCWLEGCPSLRVACLSCAHVLRDALWHPLNLQRSCDSSCSTPLHLTS
jgi:hypothetical protein